IRDLWSRRHQSEFLFLAGGAERVYLGGRSFFQCADRNGTGDRFGQIQHRTGGRWFDDAKAVGGRQLSETALVGRGSGEPQGCEPDAAATLRELQFARWLVPHQRTHRHGKLEFQPVAALEHSDWWRRRQDIQDRRAARHRLTPGFRLRRTSEFRSTLGGPFFCTIAISSLIRTYGSRRWPGRKAIIGEGVDP